MAPQDQYHQEGMSGFIEEAPLDPGASEGPQTFFAGRASELLPGFTSVVTVCYDLRRFLVLGQAGLAWQFVRGLESELGFSLFIVEQGPRTLDESWSRHAYVNLIQPAENQDWTWKILAFGHSDPVDEQAGDQPSWLLQFGTRTPPYGKPHFFKPDTDELKRLFIPKLIQVENFLAKPEFGILPS
ncbi:MAG TPA: hypothetical protein VNG90_04720 [Candidatus Acidoferrum sp.]|nr:hypothetical protein [Candidatus Acidoferrum sp.]